MMRHEYELYHHGILGMKWGVRRYQNPDGTWKNAKAKDRHSRQEAKSEHHSNIGSNHSSKQNTLSTEKKKRYAYGADYDHGFTLKKGTKINRVSMTDDENETGRTYAAFKDKDIQHYIDNGKMLADMFGAKSYSYEYVAKENLKFPSRKEKVDAYIKLINDDPDFRTFLNKNISQKSREKQEKSFDKFQYKLVSRNKRSEKYFNEMEKRGYNAMLDDADMRQNISDMPIIVIDRGKSLALKSITENK